VEGVGTGAGGDQHLAGRGDLTRDVLRRAIELKSPDRAGWHVENGGTDGLISDVLTVQQDAGGASATPLTESAE